MGTPELTGPRQAWDREYSEVRAYTTSYRGDLDRAVHFLLGYLATLGEVIDGPIVDCGCGMGRNAIPLARMGHEVVGLEHSGAALRRLAETLGSSDVSGRLTTLQHDLNDPLPIDDAYAAAVLDITAVDNLVDVGRRRGYGREVARILRPGGVAVVATFARDDGYYGPWLEGSRWREDGVVEDPHTGIRNQLFTPGQLDGVFVPPLSREAAAVLVFVDEAAQERWTRRFLLHLYRSGTVRHSENPLLPR